MENDLKHAFGDRNNSEFVISADGTVIVARQWSDTAALRQDLEKLVGKAETLTEPSSPPGGPAAEPGKIASGVVSRVPRPAGAKPLRVVARSPESGDPAFLKLRAEAAPPFGQEKGGAVHLSFQLDPIHRVHWNNLAEPLRVSFTVPEGVTVSPGALEAEKVEKAEADRDPRDFLVDVSWEDAEKPLVLAAHYFPCDDDDRWCKAVTQVFELHWVFDPDAGRVQGGAAVPRRPGLRPGMPDPARMLTRFDSDEDGRISREEAPPPMTQRFRFMDEDKDGFISKEELERSFARRRGE